jgi:hypothetical protein
MANPGGQGLEVQRVEHARRERPAPERGGAAEPLANTRRARPRNGDQGGGYAHRRVCDLAIPAGATGGFWAGADWVLCRDPTGGPPVARPVEPGTFALVAGLPGRVGLLRGYGNAIVPQVAAAFIRSALDALADILP